MNGNWGKMGRMGEFRAISVGCGARVAPGFHLPVKEENLGVGIIRESLPSGPSLCFPFHPLQYHAPLACEIDCNPFV